MQRRTHESPMDFEWQSGPPLSPTSPFTQLAQKQGKKPGFSFATPSKPPTTSTIQSSSFASGATPAPAFRNPSFTTPRRPFDTDLFSETSGAESSPANNADAEDTPETTRTAATMTAFSGRSEKKQIFGKFGLDYKGISPGRGELRRQKYSDVVAHKIKKRNRVLRLQHGRRASSDSDSESGDRHNGGGNRSTSGHDQLKVQGWLASILSFIDSKPQLPLTLANYAQFVVNAFFATFLMYIVWCCYVTIRADVDKASEVATATVLAEMSQCAKDYANNRCAPNLRAPALEAACQGWEVCMNKDASAVGRARVSAVTFADIINGFVDHISAKTMIFLAVIIVMCIGTSNFAFSSFRSKFAHPHPASQFYPPTPANEIQWGPIPQTPRHPSGQNMYLHNGMGQAIMPSQTPARAGSPRKGGWQ